MEGTIMAHRKKNVVAGKTGMTRTTLILPVELWQEAKIRAIRDGCDLTDVVRIALERYLGAKGGAR
jgi:hypothetical protein